MVAPIGPQLTAGTMTAATDRSLTKVRGLAAAAAFRPDVMLLDVGLALRMHRQNGLPVVIGRFFNTVTAL
jgi:hypothetical protein